MTGNDPKQLAAHLRAIARAANSNGGLPDAELVRRFADTRDEAAFEVLVWRHGPMVWGTCQRILRHQQDAEDAFQATFLALARSAGSVGRRESIAGWLYRVASNAALKLKSHRRPHAELTPEAGAPSHDPADHELTGVLDEELNRLPDHYRTAFILCCLGGMTSAEAARQLGCPVGTVDSRLHTARTRLRQRLARRGFAPAVLAGIAVVTAPPEVLAAAIALGTFSRTPSPTLDQLANQIGRTMSRATMTLAIVTTTALAASLVVAVWAFDSPLAPPPQPARPAVAPAPRPRDAGQSLLFAELVLKPGETGSHTLRLVRATFRDGKLDAREDIHTGDASEFGYQSQYRVIGDRYVVLPSATVVDLAQKKVHYSFDRGQVVAVEGTAVYFYNVKDGPTGVLRYDIATGVVGKVAEPAAGRWGLRGAASPGGTKTITRQWKYAVPIDREQAYTLTLEHVGKPRESLGEFAATCGTTGAGSFNDTPPGVWLDDDRFLTQTTLGKVVILNTAEKKQEKVVEVTLTHKPGEKMWDTIGASGFTPLGLLQPRFSLMPDGRVVYEADVVYFIDVANKTWEKVAWRPLGHGFEYSAVPDKIVDVDRYSKTVTVSLRYKGKVIGTSESAWGTTVEKPRVAAADSYLAVIERVQRPGKVVPMDAIRVWSAATGEWVTLDGWAESLIGWVK